jgi:hypothetical protein
MWWIKLKQGQIRNYFQFITGSFTQVALMRVQLNLFLTRSLDFAMASG